jgi:ankyrin repeat protein
MKKSLLIFTLLLVFGGCRKKVEPEKKYRYTSPSGQEFVIACNAVNNNDFKLLETQLKKGLDPDIKLLDGTTLLINAAGMGRLECVKVLLEHGADVNIACPEGTALHQVISFGSDNIEQIVKLLLEAGIDVTIEDDEGFTALDNARVNKLKECIALIEQKMKELGIKIDTSELEKELSTVPGVSIRYVTGHGDSFQTIKEDGLYVAENVDLFDVLEFLCPEDIAIGDFSALPQRTFNITCQASRDDPNLYWNMITAAIEKAFDVTIKKQKQEFDVKVLRCLPNATLELHKVPDDRNYSYGTSETGYKFQACFIEHLEEALEQELGIEVVNETGLEGKYDFEVEMNLFRPETFAEGLKEIGLELVDARRSIEIIAIRKKNASQQD